VANGFACCRTVTIYYGSGSGSDILQIPVPVPAPYLEHRKQLKTFLGKKLAFLFNVNRSSIVA
jgi:hypothetical protein